MIKLAKNERLVQAGTVALRAPDGTPLPAVPQYIIVPADKADPAAIRAVRKNERLLYGGQILDGRGRAEERFDALKEGRKQPPRETGTPFYFIENAAKADPKTGRTAKENKIIITLSTEFAAAISAQIKEWYRIYCSSPEIWKKMRETEAKIGRGIMKGVFLKDFEPQFEAQLQLKKALERQGEAGAEE